MKCLPTEKYVDSLHRIYTQYLVGVPFARIKHQCGVAWR